MAAVYLTDLIPSLEAALSVPGTTSPYSAATDDEWLAKLKNAFWLAVLDQVISGYEMDEDGTSESQVRNPLRRRQPQP